MDGTLLVFTNNRTPRRLAWCCMVLIVLISQISKLSIVEIDQKPSEVTMIA